MEQSNSFFHHQFPFHFLYLPFPSMPSFHELYLVHKMMCESLNQSRNCSGELLHIRVQTEPNAVVRSVRLFSERTISALIPVFGKKPWFLDEFFHGTTICTNTFMSSQNEWFFVEFFQFAHVLIHNGVLISEPRDSSSLISDDESDFLVREFSFVWVWVTRRRRLQSVFPLQHAVLIEAFITP